MNMSDAPPKKRGCFFYGCITCVVVFLVIGILAFAAFRYITHRIDATVAQYTDATPMPLPRVEVPAAELAQLQKRIDAFNQAAKIHTNTPPLILTGRDVNALLASSPEMKGFSNRFYITIESNQVRGQVSLPLNDFRIPFVNFKGRYLNGAGNLNVSITNHLLWVSMEALEVKGKPLPEKYMSQLREQNLAQEANNNPTNAAAIANYESIEVKDGRIIVKARQNR
jgi:hypothetical protein